MGSGLSDINQIIIPLPLLKNFIRNSSIKEKPHLTQNYTELKNSVFKFLKENPVEIERYIDYHFAFEKYRSKHIYLFSFSKLKDKADHFLNIIEQNVKEKNYIFQYSLVERNPWITFCKKYEDSIVFCISEVRKLWKKITEEEYTNEAGIEERLVKYNKVPMQISRFYEIDKASKGLTIRIDTIGQGVRFQQKDYADIIASDMEKYSGYKKNEQEDIFDAMITSRVVDKYIRQNNVFIRKVDEIDADGNKAKFELNKMKMNDLLKACTNDSTPLEQIKEKFPQYDLLKSHMGAIGCNDKYNSEEKQFWTPLAEINIIYKEDGKYDYFHGNLNSQNGYFKHYSFVKGYIIENELQKIRNLISRIKNR